MKLLAKILAVVLLFGASTAPVRAEPPALFRAGLVDPVKLLPAPAALETEEMRAELLTVLRVQESRTDKEVKRARADEKIRIDSFQTALGPWLTANNLPRLQALFERMEKEAKVHSDIAKNHFKRPRPLVADPRVKPLFEQSDPGYPSGHALRGQMFALVLSELAPDKAETLLGRGREIGWSRVVGGVHFPSDVSAGRTLGQALAREMLANPAIRTELAEIHREFDAARQQSRRASKRFMSQIPLKQRIGRSLRVIRVSSRWQRITPWMSLYAEGASSRSFSARRWSNQTSRICRHSSLAGMFLNACERLI
jgi:acid phosphatase (class A)